MIPAGKPASMTAEGNGLGLRLGRVVIADHNPRWSALYADLVPELRAALGEHSVEIEHVGSTAVPDLVAKPILDVVVGLPEPIDPPAVIAALGDAGFRFDGDLGRCGGLLFLLESVPDLVLANVHVVEVDGQQWRRYLAFRDGLRVSEELRRQYGRLKADIAKRYADDRDGYSRAKFDWVLRTVRDLDRPWDRRLPR